MAYESGTNNYSDTIANGNTLPPRSRRDTVDVEEGETLPIACNNFCVTRQIDDDEQAFKMLDKVSHLKNSVLKTVMITIYSSNGPMILQISYLDYAVQERFETSYKLCIIRPG